VQVAGVAPALFAANASGQGVAAATAVRVNGGVASPVAVFRCGDEPLSCLPEPIGLDAGPVYLSLYGTGIRGAGALPAVSIGGVAAEVLFAGAQPQYVGLDQVNVLIPAALIGRGTVDVRLAVGSAVSNAVTIAIR
jgi:uncharacterized protein (TIGR03437 family)